MRLRLLFSLALIPLLASLGGAAERSRKEKDNKDANVVDRVTLARVRRIAVVPFVGLERPMPVTGFYSRAREEEEKKKWGEEKAFAAEVAKSVSELLPKAFAEWKRFEVADTKAVEEALSALKLKPTDLVQTKPNSKVIAGNAQSIALLRAALKVDAVLVGGADVRWVQYDAEVTLRIQLISDDAAQPIVSTAVAGRSSRRMKAAAQAAMLIAMLLYPSRDAEALDRLRTIAVMVLPPPEAYDDSKKDSPDFVAEAALDEAFTQQLEVVNLKPIPSQQVASAMWQMRLSPEDLVLRASKDKDARNGTASVRNGTASVRNGTASVRNGTASVPYVNVPLVQAVAEKAKADAVFVAQILDIETTLSGTGWGVPPLIPYVGSIISSPLFRHKTTYTVLRAQIIVPGKPYPIWTYVTQGMPPRKMLQNPKYAGAVGRFFTDLSAQMIWDMSGQVFALPGAARR